jgi:hypothetical protein
MTKFKVGDLVRVKQLLGGLGDTLWEITELFPQGGCLIREAGTDFVPHRFDTSLLAKPVRYLSNID